MDLVLATINFIESESEILNAWNQIANLKPCLPDHIEFVRHQYRQQSWYILIDGSTQNHYRCTSGAYQFLLLLDGLHTVEQAYMTACATSKSPLIKKQLLQLVAQLKAADLLQGDFPRDVNEIAQRSLAIKRHNRWQQWLRPLSIKVPLLDPDQFLSKALPLVAPLFHPSILVVWCVLTAYGGVTALLNTPELIVHWQSRFTDPQNLLWLLLLYPFIKALHELGHAFTTKIWGGEVNEMGIMLLVFQPVPYVDTTSSHRFEKKSQRIFVGAAGIMVELLLAAIALLFWANSEAGFYRDMAFNVAVIGGISTLFFNGNPLLRFDGYYILSDLIEIPNLSSRSNQYLGYLIKRYMLGMHASHSPVTAHGERRWFITCGITSGIYRLFITFTIALWVAKQFFILGVILAVWALIIQIFYPAIKQLSKLLLEVIKAGKLRRLLIVTLFLFALLTFSFTIPIPQSTFVKGIIILPEDALVRAKSTGIVVNIEHSDGTFVTAGEPLLILEDIQLETTLAVLISRQQELEARQKAVLLDDRTQSEIFKSELITLLAEIQLVKEQIQGLIIRSPTNGTLSLPYSKDLPGRFIQKGEIIGHVLNLSTVNARVVIPQTAIDLVRHHTQAVMVKLNSLPEETLVAKIEREVPLATNQLPSKILGSQAGGEIAVDARDVKGLQAVSNIFQVDITLPVKSTGNYLGQGVSVRFIHKSEPLALTLYHKIKLFAYNQFLA